MRGTFQGNNNFIAELSDGNGRFASPSFVGFIRSKSSGTICCTIPGILPSGNFCSIRVRSTNPALTGITSGHLLSIQPCSVTGDKINSLNVYPNPASSITISFTVLQRAKLAFQLYDMSGRLVSTIAHKTFGTGQRHIKWNIGAVNGGVCLLKMESMNSSQTQKVL